MFTNVLSSGSYRKDDMEGEEVGREWCRYGKARVLWKFTIISNYPGKG